MTGVGADVTGSGVCVALGVGLGMGVGMALHPEDSSARRINKLRMFRIVRCSLKLELTI